jgi:hypothetical protein
MAGTIGFASSEDVEYNYGLAKRKGAYLPFSMAFPQRYVLDSRIIGPMTPTRPRPPVRVRPIITAGFWASRHPSGKARKGAHARCMQPFAQRSRAGWIGIPKWVVIVERALSTALSTWTLRNRPPN